MDPYRTPIPRTAAVDHRDVGEALRASTCDIALLLLIGATRVAVALARREAFEAEAILGLLLSVFTAGWLLVRSDRAIRRRRAGRPWFRGELGARRGAPCRPVSQAPRE